jgi:hypothetical protein
MALVDLKNYRKLIDALTDVRDELADEGTIENALRTLKQAYFQKTTEKQRASFVRAQYKAHGEVDSALLNLYNRTLEESKKNEGDGPQDNSGMVTHPVALLQKRFGTKTITAAHLTQLKEDIKQSLINQELTAFLESKMEGSSQSETAVTLQTPKRENTAGYTKKRQAVALYVILDALQISSENRSDIGRLLHLLIAKPVPKKKGTDKVAMNESNYYEAYSEVVNNQYTKADLDFVASIFSALKSEDRRHSTAFDNVIEEMRKKAVR